jgi:hypothetical protein
MPVDPTPTHQDIENARRRRAIADRFRAEYERDERLAVALFGPGWTPVGRHDLIDHAGAERCRRTGDRPTPAASVYTAGKDGRRRHFMLVGGQPREVAGYEAGFGAALTEPDTERTIDVRGQAVHPHRYGLYWSGYEPEYTPRTAEQLAAARERREQKAAAQEQEAIEKLATGSLFPDWIREQAAQRKKPRNR